MIILNEKLHDFTLKDLEPIVSKYKEFYFSLIDKHGFVKIDQLNKIRDSFGGNLTQDRLSNGLKKFVFYKSSTQLLRSKSKSIETANLFNSVPIFIGTCLGYSTSYIFGEQIFLSISIDELFLLENCYKNKKSVFLEKSAESFVRNLKDCEHNVSHEIAHWIDDSITNFVKPKFYNIKKIAKVNEIDFDKLMTTPNVVINSQFFEINAQIHAIKTIREKYLYEWDKYTIYDVISKNTALEAVYKTLAFYSLKYANNWITHLLKRMYREKLLHIIDDLSEEGWSIKMKFPENQIDYERMGLW